MKSRTEDLPSRSINLQYIAGSWLRDLGYYFSFPCHLNRGRYVLDSRHSTVFKQAGYSKPGIQTSYTVPKNGYLGISINILPEQEIDTVWCNTEEQVISVINNFDLVIRHWHSSMVKLDSMYRQELISKQREYEESINQAVSLARETMLEADEDEEMGWYPQ